MGAVGRQWGGVYRVGWVRGAFAVAALVGGGLGGGYRLSQRGLFFVGACPDWSTCSQIPVRMLAVFASVWAAVNVSCLNGNILCEVRAQKIN